MDMDNYRVKQAPEASSDLYDAEESMDHKNLRWCFSVRSKDGPTTQIQQFSDDAILRTFKGCTSCSTATIRWRCKVKYVQRMHQLFDSNIPRMMQYLVRSKDAPTTQLQQFMMMQQLSSVKGRLCPGPCLGPHPSPAPNWTQTLLKMIELLRSFVIAFYCSLFVVILWIMVCIMEWQWQRGWTFGRRGA